MAIRTEGHIVRVNSKVVGDLESLGDISQKRDVKKYKSINTGNIVAISGTIDVDPISLSVLYDPADSEGIGELESAFKSGLPTPFEIELSNKPDGGTNGTKYTWSETVISEFKVTQEESGGVLASFTATVDGEPTVTAAA